MANKPCPKCGGKTIMVEYGLMDKHHYDGVSEIDCLDKKCGYREGRFCGKELGANEVEPRFHAGEKHPKVFVLEQNHD